MFDANFTNRIQIHGNGKQHRAFIHVNILIKALIGCLLNEVPSGTYNVVDKNLQILDLVDMLKEIYPELEFIFINQHLNLRQMRVDPHSLARRKDSTLVAYRRVLNLFLFWCSWNNVEPRSADELDDLIVEWKNATGVSKAHLGQLISCVELVLPKTKGSLRWARSVLNDIQQNP